MPNLKELRIRIRSINNTQKITKAMKMVSAAKLRRAQENIVGNRPYQRKLQALLTHLAADADLSAHPLVAEREQGKIGIVLIAGDRGLCGAFNNNVFKAALRYFEEHPERQPGDYRLYCVGKRARDFFRRRPWPTAQAWPGIFRKFGFDQAQELLAEIRGAFDSGELREVQVFYNEFRSALSQVTQRERLLPLDLTVEPAAEGEEPAFAEALYEPDRDGILQVLVPQYVQVLFYRMCLDSIAGEHGARMTAMDSATNNCVELSRKLTIKMNRARQAAITTELMEIIAGAEAL